VVSVLLSVFLALAVLAGCGGDDDSDSGNANSALASCDNPGATHDCTCWDGSQGTHTCGQDGTWEICDCPSGGGTAGAAGANGEGIVECGGETCPEPQDLDLSTVDLGNIGEVTHDMVEAVGIARKPTACCTAADNCGLNHPQFTPSGKCYETNQVGKPSAECPDATLNFELELLTLPLTFKGCCRDDNMCGIDIAATHVGCVERTAVEGRGLEAIPCTY
jgi:hypothetical protein